MKYLYLILLAFLISACDSSRIYEDYHDFDESFWHMDSVQSFQFQMEDTSKATNLLATFRNSAAYPFYNLYFQYNLLDSANNVLVEQLEEYHFFDPKTGAPLGSGLGDLFDHAVILQEKYKFPAKGVYTIQLKQFMRMDTLPYILSVGARVEIVE